ncbi:MAG: hypothetical protein NT096_00600 [Proteobacteria bacterium]|nr:hypothetical protein [Pseudomonadota bacterium]
MPETLNEILSHFHALKAPGGPNGKVSGDFDKVQAQIKHVEVIYDRIRNRSPSPEERAEAGIWFGTVQNLRSRQKFQEYVEKLQGMFWDMAKAMPNATSDLLIQVAKDKFDFDDDFARRTVEEGLPRRPEDPWRVLNLEAHARPKCVKLNWRRPSNNCDKIIVQRNEVGTNTQPKTIVDNQCRDDYPDKDIEPGKRYKYMVYSLFQGLTNRDPAEIEVLVPVEVHDLRAECKVSEGKLRVELSWKPPDFCTGVVVFRKIGNQPADADTDIIKEIDDGKCGSYSDEAVVEGKDHYYLLVARFEVNGRSDGVFSKKVPVPQTPGRVDWAKATYDGKTNSVSFEWKSLAESGPIDYLVVRRGGEFLPHSLSEGELVVETKETKCVDKGHKKELEPGRVYSYTVFCRRQGLLSREGTPTNQIITCREMDENDLICEPGDGEIILSWKLPKTAVDVLLQRTIDPTVPGGPNDKSAFQVPHSPEGARDTGLTNNTGYNYRVCCVYRLPDGQPGYSDGILKKGVTPKEAPPPIRNLVLTREGDGVRIIHEPVTDAKVVIYRCPKPPPVQCGDLVRAADTEKWGGRIDRDGPTTALDKAPKSDWLYYFPVTFRVSQTTGTMGQIRRLPIPEVTDLGAFVVDAGVRLRWQWPESCEFVRVRRRIGTWPEGLEDSSATRLDVTHDEYNQKGESALDRLPPKAGEVQEVYYVAYSRIGNEFASGDADGSRCHISVKRVPELEFDWQPNHRSVLVRWRFDSVPDNFSGFVLTGNPDRPPFDESDGNELLRCVPDSDSNGNLTTWHEHRIALAKGKNDLYHRVFLVQRNDYSRIRITYPKQPAQVSGRRRPRKQVVCPHCFKTFSVWQIRFRYGKDDPNSGNNYPLPKAWWARINPFYRMQLKMPTGPDGRAFADKLCPHCCSGANLRALPYTAGAHRSLIIGLLGASGAGKTHYVVSLVQRLRNMGYELCDIDDDTISRFTKLQIRLFKDKTPLTLTQRDREPPLIYSLDGKTQSCTLALHDTAGEHLIKGKDILMETPYLREADGLIFLVDPLQCATLAGALGKKASDELAGLVMDAVINAFHLWGVKMKGEKFTVPLALVFTKADILRDAGLINNDLLWHQPIFNEGGYNVHLHQDTDAAFGRLVAGKDTKLFTGVTKHFRDHAFFGVSATGCNAEQGHFSRVVPHRVEDPLLWLLFRLGVIEGR